MAKGTICGVWAAGDFRERKFLGHSFKIGIEKMGWRIEQHYPSLLQDTDLPYADIVLANGTRGPIKSCIVAMNRKGKSVLVYDLGYLDRADGTKPDGYYQMGINRLGWTPPFDCPPDRFENLGLKVVDVLSDPSNKKVLVCAQKFGDGQHGMGPVQMINLMTSTCAKYAKMGYEVIFRPHPKSPFEIPGYETSKLTMQEELQRVGFMVTYNSTSGVEALLAGKPVVALSDTAHYFGVSSEITEDGGLTTPPLEDLKRYFYRLAYSQWKKEEIEAAIPFKFLVCHLSGINPFSKDFDWCCLQPKTSPQVAPVGKPYQAGTPKTGTSPAPVADKTTVANPSTTFDNAQKVWPDFTGLRWMTIKKMVTELTGLTPKNKVDAENIRKIWEQGL